MFDPRGSEGSLELSLVTAVEHGPVGGKGPQPAGTQPPGQAGVDQFALGFPEVDAGQLAGQFRVRAQQGHLRVMPGSIDNIGHPPGKYRKAGILRA